MFYWLLSIVSWWSTYYRKYGTCKRCNGCQRPVFPGHWMRESKEMIYHLTCFCCVVCKRQLSTGEEYGLSSNEVYCLLHFNELLADPQDRGNNIYVHTCVCVSVLQAYNACSTVWKCLYHSLSWGIYVCDWSCSLRC